MASDTQTLRAVTRRGTSDAFHRLRALASSWNPVEPGEAVRECALRLLRVHPLTATDSQQLAAAVVAAENRPSSLGLVTLDQRLADAAEREGFNLLRPG